MADWHSHIYHDILAVRVVDDVGQHLPRVQECVTLKETVEHAIAYEVQSIPLCILRASR